MGRRSLRSDSVWLALPAVVLMATLGLARPPARPERRMAADGRPRLLGADFCASCHTAPGNPAFRGSLDHVLLNEFTVWSGDRHATAYRSLESPRGVEMGRLLGVDVKAPEVGCLGCHSASTMHGGVEYPIGDAFRKADGVSCENCHGASEAWIGPHTQHDWRGKSVAEKEALGMFDLRDPARQATACLSCHVGNKEEKKVVTHAMFAVGHPPLPSIDVATFGDQIPRHWRLLREKPGADSSARFERTRLALASSSLALKAAMTLLAEESKSGAAGVPGGSWPDYARFDCASCHHELVRERDRPSRRQERGYAGAPGRPPLTRWSNTLVRASIEALLGPEAAPLLAAMGEREKALLEATHARPFGRLPELSKAAAEYASWADEAAGRLGGVPLDEGLVRALLLRIARESAGMDLDYDAARLAARTAWALYADLGPDAKSDREIVAALGSLSRDLDLGLPDRPGHPAGRPGTIERGLPEALRSMRDYDAGRAREGFRTLADALGRP